MSGEAEDSVTWLISWSADQDLSRSAWNSSVGFASRALHLYSWPQPPNFSAVQCVVQCVLCCVCLNWMTSCDLCCAVCTSRMPRDLITTVPLINWLPSQSQVISSPWSLYKSHITYHILAKLVRLRLCLCVVVVVLSLLVVPFILQCKYLPFGTAPQFEEGVHDHLWQAGCLIFLTWNLWDQSWIKYQDILTVRM